MSSTKNTSTSTSSRPQRKKVYERVREAQIPKYLQEQFAKDGYEIRLIRWAIRGEPDYRYLNRREQEGYEFVSKDELPEEYLRTMRIRDTSVSKGLVTNGGDLCLMKVDSDLRRSRKEYFEDLAQSELKAVDINVLEKKHGLKNTGTRSKVVLREPTFNE